MRRFGYVSVSRHNKGTKGNILEKKRREELQTVGFGIKNGIVK